MIKKLLAQRFGRKRQQVCLGVEFAPGGIAWAHAPRDGATPTTGFLEVADGNYAAGLENLVDERSLKRPAANLVLSQDQCQIFQAERPPVEDHEMADAVRWKLGDLLEYSASEAVIDTFPFPEDATRDRGQLINAACAHQKIVGDLVAAVHKADVHLNRIDIAELALRNLLARADPEERGGALLYLSEHHGHMVFCRGGTLYMARRIEISLRQLRDAGSQEQSVQALALEMQRSLDYFESQLRQVPPGRIQVTGHPDALPLAGMLSSNVTAEVVDFDWSLIMGEDAAAPDPRAALAFGTLLDGGGQGA